MSTIAIFPSSKGVGSLKRQNAIYQRVSDSLLLPTIIQFQDNLYGLIFRLMKLLPARNILFKAREDGEIKNNFTIVDTSSGTFALGLGLICCELGLKFKIFGDPAIDQNLIRVLQDLGGSVHRIEKSKNPGAYQRERLTALNSFIENCNKSFWTKQYDNPANKESYYVVSDLINSALGKDVNIIGPVGSGGSTGGIIDPLRQCNEEAQLIGVDTFNSVLFGQKDGRRALRGLGNSIMPQNLDHTLYDEVHWINANLAFSKTRWLHSKKGLFCGPTTGAAFCVADYLASKNPNRKYVFIAPDEGYRYLETIYSDPWLKANKFSKRVVESKPIEVSHPLEANPPWAFIKWGRRALEMVA